MSFLTREAERVILSWMLSPDSAIGSAPFVEPVEARLVRTTSSKTTAGTPINANDYEPVDVAWTHNSSVTSSTEFVNVDEIQFGELDETNSVTIAGVELWDSSQPPIRLGYINLDTSVTIAAGESFEIEARQFKVRLT